MVTENYLKSPDMHLEVLKTKKIYVSLQETPCFTYQIDKIQENKASYKKLLKNRKLSLANAGNIWDSTLFNKHKVTKAIQENSYIPI